MASVKMRLLAFFKEHWFPFVMLLLFSILCLTSLVQWSATSDELDHITGGYAKIKLNFFELNREHPPLINMISAVPLLILNPKLDTESSTWRSAEAHDIGQEFLYKDNRQMLDDILLYSRSAIVFLGVLLGILVYLFAYELYGKRAASLAVFLYALCPNIIAHSSLVTTDLGLTLFSFAAVYAFWRLLKKPSNMRLIVAGIAFGLMMVSKFSAIYFLPIFGALIIIASACQKDKKKETFIRYCGYFAVILLITYAVIWVSYLFHTDKAFDAPIREKVAYGMSRGVIGKVMYTVMRAIPIPYDYLFGLNYVIENITVRPSFLMGQYSTSGWWYYFPIAFLIKTPVAAIILLIMSFTLFSQVRSKEISDELFTIVPAAIFLLIFMGSTINIGVRHILPIYPFLFVFTSKVANAKMKWAKVSIAILCIWCAVSALFIWPHYIAYFNELIGGPKNGYKYLGDSNIDWGQDLKGLAKYMDDHNITNITISYWSGNEPVEARIRRYNPLTCEIKHGWFAISAWKLIGTNPESGKCLQWLKKEEPVDNIGYSIFIYHIE